MSPIRPMAFVIFALSLLAFYTSVLEGKLVANNARAVGPPYIQKNNGPAIRVLKSFDSSSFAYRHFQRLNPSRRPGRSPNAAEDALACRWDDVAETCAVSYGAIAELLGASKNVHAQFTAQFVECLTAVDEDACFDMSKCHWDSASASCRFLDFYTENEESPCAVAADGQFRVVVEESKCKLHQTHLPCFADPGCSWEYEDHDCVAEYYPFFIGISFDALSRAAVEVQDVQDHETAFLSSFDLEAAEPDWSGILDWKPPKTFCPEWSDQMVCDFASDLSRITPQSFYCLFRYRGESLKNCSADPLCVIDEASGSCHLPYETELSNFDDAFKNIISSYVEPPVDRKILLQGYECSTQSEDTTCKDPCVWVVHAEIENPFESCELPFAWTLENIVDAGDESDVLCNFAATVASAGCEDIIASDVCTANTNCTATGVEGCTMSVEYQIRTVIEEDRKLRKAYNKLAKNCGSYSTEETCLSVS